MIAELLTNQNPPPWEWTLVTAPDFVRWTRHGDLRVNGDTLLHPVDLLKEPVDVRRHRFYELVGRLLGPIPSSQMYAHTNFLGIASWRTLGPGQDHDPTPTAAEVYADAMTGRRVPLSLVADLNRKARNVGAPTIAPATPLTWGDATATLGPQPAGPVPWHFLASHLTVTPEPADTFAAAWRLVADAHRIAATNPLAALTPLTDHDRLDTAGWVAQSAVFDAVLSYGIVFSQAAMHASRHLTTTAAAAVATLNRFSTVRFAETADGNRINAINTLLHTGGFTFGRREVHGTTVRIAGTHTTTIVDCDGIIDTVAIGVPTPTAVTDRRTESLRLVRYLLGEPDPKPRSESAAAALGTWLQRVYGVEHLDPVAAAFDAFAANTASDMDLAIVGAFWGLQ